MNSLAFPLEPQPKSSLSTASSHTQSSTCAKKKSEDTRIAARPAKLAHKAASGFKPRGTSKLQKIAKFDQKVNNLDFTTIRLMF